MTFYLGDPLAMRALHTQQVELRVVILQAQDLEIEVALSVYSDIEAMSVKRLWHLCDTGISLTAIPS